MTTQTLQQTDSLLSRTLRANSIFCASSGLFFALGFKPVAEFLGIQDSEILGFFNGETALLVLGIGLMLYALPLFILARSEPIDQLGAVGAIVGDFLWVIGSIVLLLADWLPLSSAGSWAILIVADIVLVFAIAQTIGLRRLRNSQ